MKIFRILLLSIISLSVFSCKTDQKDQSTTENTIDLKFSEEKAMINGVEHYISKYGEGEPIIVLHGGPGLFQDFLTPHFKKLAEKYQVVFYDQRGCGKTEFPKDTTTINVNQFVEDLDAVRKYLKIEKMTLAGHSWGAILAINYAKKYSDNLKNLVLISPAPANPEYFDQLYKNMQNKRTDEDIKNLVKVMSSKEFDERKPEAILEAVKIGDQVNFADKSKVDTFYSAIKFTAENAEKMLTISSIMEKNFFDFNLIEGMDKINCPTLIVIGDLDNVPFASSQLIQENIKNARLESIQHAAQYPFFESPQDFNFIIKSFLNPEYEQ